MTVYCKLDVSGRSIQTSAHAFVKSAKTVANTNHLKQYQNILNSNFQRYLTQYMHRAGIEDIDDLEKSFYINIIGNSIIFGNTQPIIANRYEYGWEEDDDYDEDEYSISTSPRYYIRPAVRRITEDIAEILTKDAFHEYDKEIQNASESQLIWENENTEYFNKYNGIL